MARHIKVDSSSTLLSLVLFEKGFCNALWELGHEDALEKETEIREFFRLRIIGSYSCISTQLNQVTMKPPAAKQTGSDLNPPGNRHRCRQGRSNHRGSSPNIADDNLQHNKNRITSLISVVING